MRFSTAGSVDDGKSTLIGRLLFEAKAVFEDQLAAVQKSTERRGRAGVDLALITDGLEAEREQGITIDVAYRYFATPKRKFIIADTPGHEQYTRNMVTGASTADLALILVDAQKGVLDQSRRHAAIAALLGIPDAVVCVNKMDLAGYGEARFREIETAFRQFAANLKFSSLRFVPISALIGDNVVSKSDKMPWYGGATVMELLEAAETGVGKSLVGLRFPVQYVNRPNADYRGYCGVVAGGVARPGQEVVVLPSGRTTRIRSVTSFDGDLEEAFAPMSVTLMLEDELDVGRGDLIAEAAARPTVASEFSAEVCWMADEPLKRGGKYLLKHGAMTVKALVTAVRNKLDVGTMTSAPAETLELNAIGVADFKTVKPLVFDAYAENRATGGFILIDEFTNRTVGAGMMAKS